MKNFKITAFAAAAILGAVMLTGCGNILNQNGAPIQPATQAAQQASGQQAQVQNVQQAQNGQNTQQAQAAPVSNTASIQNYDFSGDYHEEIAGRGQMAIGNNGDGTYSVSVSWAGSASERCCWSFSGSFDSSSGILYYNNGNMTVEAFDENGNYICDSNGIQTPYSVYSAGSGYLAYDGSGFIWHDDMGYVAEGSRFVA